MIEFLFLHWPDTLALAFFFATWVGYAHFADRPGQHNLLAITTEYRLSWMREMLKRENRTLDAMMMGNLTRSITFFANTTIFILLGLVGVLGNHERASAILSTIPFAAGTTEAMWEIKMFTMLLIFTYAFFKYTWSLRQYNYASIFVAAAPAPKERLEEHEKIAHKGAYLVSNAARHFNNALRAYYFGMAALAWFIHPLAFLAATGWVVFVTHRREYRSGTLQNLAS